MTAPVYLAGTGLLSALGDLSGTVQALRLPPPEAPAVALAPGWSFPLRLLPPPYRDGDWHGQLALAVRAVVAHSGIVPAPDVPLFLASSSLDIGYEEERARAGHSAFVGDQHSFADAVARALDWPGPVFCFSSACTSAAQALLAARDWLRAGESADALVLGVETHNLFTPAGFGGLQLLSPDRTLPFARARNGLVLGQAVAALHLRLAPTRWRLAGGANVVDGSQPTGAVPEAVQAAARAAMNEAACPAREISLLKPQAAGSPGNDAAEAEALHALFGAAIPPMMGFKPWIGHTMGASAAAELALLMASLDAGVWPARFAVGAPPDPALGLGRGWGPPPEATDAATAPCRVLFHTIGFGGGHAALVLEREVPCTSA